MSLTGGFDYVVVQLVKELRTTDASVIGFRKQEEWLCLLMELPRDVILKILRFAMTRDLRLALGIKPGRLVYRDDFLRRSSGNLMPRRAASFTSSNGDTEYFINLGPCKYWITYHPRWDLLICGTLHEHYWLGCKFSDVLEWREWSVVAVT